MLNRIRAWIRLIRFAFYTIYYIVTLLSWKAFSKDEHEPNLVKKQNWSAGLCRILGFNIEMKGDPQIGEPCVYVGNHRSSLDPIIPLGHFQASPISRAEVRNWPLIGHGARNAGVIFVDKKSRESRARTKDALLVEMQQGRSVLIYPEGRTNVEPETITFQKGAFDQAARGGFPVVPFAMEYKSKADYWDHTDSFLVHFLKNFGKRRTDIRITYGEPLRSDNPWTLLRAAQGWINEQIVEMREDWDAEEEAK